LSLFQRTSLFREFIETDFHVHAETLRRMHKSTGMPVLGKLYLNIVNLNQFLTSSSLLWPWTAWTHRKSGQTNQF